MQRTERWSRALRGRALAALLILGAAGPSGAAEVVPAPTIPDTLERPAAVAAAPFAWSVRAAGETRPVQHVLVGSVHVLPETAYPLPAGLEAAWEQTQGLVLETDPAQLQEPDFQKRMLDAARAPDGLRSTIAPELYERLRARTAAAGLPMTLCDPFRAWFCALSLELFSLQTQGISGEFGLDLHFYEQARRRERPVRWLESPEAQLRLFAGMAGGLESEFLASTVDELGDPARDTRQLIADWRQDDREALERIVLDMKRDYPAAYERLLAQRNRDWMLPLEALLREGPAQLVVVGAAHLVGPDGLPARLAARGWIVKPLPEPAATTPAPADVPVISPAAARL